VSTGLAIQIQNVTKRYDDFTAVDDISFDVRAGIIFGLLGPNGAGKTTTIRMIMNIIIPDSGSIRVLGRPSTETTRLIGYLPEERGLYRRMKVGDHLVFLGEIRGLEPKLAKQRVGEWLERLDLAGWRDKKVEELSKGMQQKIQFIGCILHEPDILILDEPFSGLDPVNARVLKELLQEYRAKGKTVVFSTHVMEQAEKLCDEIALIDRAHVVLKGRLDEIKQNYSGNRLVLGGGSGLERVAQIKGVLDYVQRDGEIEVELDPSIVRSEFLREATALCAIDSAVPHEASLDEIFVKVVNPEAARLAAVRGES
jgi:ABC-type uncharacterized transport system, ATPase component